MAKINKTQSDKKLKLPNIKRRNNRVALLKVHSIAMRLAYQMLGLRGKIFSSPVQFSKTAFLSHGEKIHWERGCENSCFVTKKC